MKGIVQTLEKTLAEIHITNRVDGFGENDTSRKLTVAVAPVVLNTFKMPLVNQDNNFLALRLIYCLEEILIALVN